ncbi:hypothetical protein [Streptomyces lydicus]|uniref:hypothetical protein n=1 Tax=Streptomyces lydicus TaxID=47763 RepID=UPI0036F0014F
MFGKKIKEMTPEQAEAALQAAAAENDAKRERDRPWLRCDNGHILYAGEIGCRTPGCRG